jgi:hypothetical protein
LHPELYEAFRRFARQARDSGLKRYSADAILHRIRWHEIVEKGNGEYAVNNDWAAPLARKLMAEFPGEFGGFFETRKTRTDRDIEEAHRDGRLFR